MQKILIVPVLLGALLAGGAARIVQDQCGPFTDVTPGFCPYILELYYLGITAGTSATTFSPDDPLTRGQGAVFIAKGLNQSLARSSRRAALGQWWTTQTSNALGLTTLGTTLQGVQSDGADLWLADSNQTIYRVRASDGKLLDTAFSTGVSSAAPLVAMGSIFFVGGTSPGQLYRADPTAPLAAQVVANDLGIGPAGLAFDGARIWTANDGSLPMVGSVSIVTPSATTPWTATTVTTGFQTPTGILFDGVNVWVTDPAAGSLLRLDAAGAIVQTVTVGTSPFHPLFDGKNIWVPNLGDSTVSVVDPGAGGVVATLTGNGLNAPTSLAFDGQRVLVVNASGVSIWNAANLQPLGFLLGGSGFLGACSDGINFWITRDTGDLARF
jgi:hypothetical protein